MCIGKTKKKKQNKRSIKHNKDFLTGSKEEL